MRGQTLEKTCCPGVIRGHPAALRSCSREDGWGRSGVGLRAPEADVVTRPGRGCPGLWGLDPPWDHGCSHRDRSRARHRSPHSEAAGTRLWSSFLMPCLIGRRLSGSLNVKVWEWTLGHGVMLPGHRESSARAPRALLPPEDRGPTQVGLQLSLAGKRSGMVI